MSDPQKKSQYDQYGHAAFESGGFGSGGMNMDDIFSQFGDIFGSAFGGVVLVDLVVDLDNPKPEEKEATSELEFSLTSMRSHKALKRK